MTKIFLSYRRGDTAGYVGRLTDRLCAHFGRDAVFRDLDSIAPGRDFTVAIDEAIASCDVVVVVIGRNWLAATNLDGGRRLDDPDDFVRVEIATALELRAQVIPVLVDGAGIPPAKSLPAPLVPLAHRNALEISDSRWDYDVQRLINLLDPASPETLSGSTLAVSARPHGRTVMLVAVGAALLLAAAVGVAAIPRGGDSRLIARSRPAVTTPTSGAAGPATTLPGTTTLGAADSRQATGGATSDGGQPPGQIARQVTTGEKPVTGVAQPLTQSPAMTPPTTAVRIQNPPPTAPSSPTADAVAGAWSGSVADGSGGTFQVTLDVRRGCTVNEKCGSVFVSNNNCAGDFILVDMFPDGRYEFSVDNFNPTSGPNCHPGRGEYLTPQGGDMVLYTTNYGPQGSLRAA